MLHLHGLEHHQQLARLHGVPLGHLHPDDATGHRGQGRAGGQLIGGHREPQLLVEDRAPVGAVDEDRRSVPVDPVPAPDPVGVERGPLGVRVGRVHLVGGAVHLHRGEVLAPGVEPVPDRDRLVADVVGGLLEGRRVVAVARRDGRLHPGGRPMGGLGGQGGGQCVPADRLVAGQRRRQTGEPVAVEEPGVGVAGQEGRVVEDADEQVAVGGHPVDPGAGQGPGQGGCGLGPGGGVHHHLGQHRVVVGTDIAARLDPAVHADVDARRLVGRAVGADLEAVEPPGGGHPTVPGVLGVQTGLDGVAPGTGRHRGMDLRRQW